MTQWLICYLKIWKNKLGDSGQTSVYDMLCGHRTICVTVLSWAVGTGSTVYQLSRGCKVSLGGGVLNCQQLPHGVCVLNFWHEAIR